jgi:hypothetical protein
VAAGLGIVATLAANVAHGWPDGSIGAAVAAWPAASLVSSYELLLWLVRTAADGGVIRDPASGQAGGPADQALAGLRLVPMPDLDVMEQQGGPDWPGPDQPVTSWPEPTGPGGAGEASIEAAPVAAYQASMDIGRPLSERKLAPNFGKTSRRWARNRMAEAHRVAGPAPANSRNAARLSHLQQMVGQPVRPDPAVREAASAP